MKRLKRWLGLDPAAMPVFRVLMVCSGNICRSPTAQAVLRSKLQRAGLADSIEVDSAGIQGLHAHEAPDPRAQAHARRRGYDLSRLRARKIIGEDFSRFQLICAMDDGHLQWLQHKAPPDSRARIELLMSQAGQHPGHAIVPDPYYGSDRDFELALDLIEDACDGWVQALRRERRGSGPAGESASAAPTD